MTITSAIAVTGSGVTERPESNSGRAVSRLSLRTTIKTLSNKDAHHSTSLTFLPFPLPTPFSHFPFPFSLIPSYILTTRIEANALP